MALCKCMLYFFYDKEKGLKGTLNDKPRHSILFRTNYCFKKQNLTLFFLADPAEQLDQVKVILA